MCNLYRLRVSPVDLGEVFRQLGLTLEWPDGRTPNLEPRDEIRIRDTAPVVRRANPGLQLSMLPWAWPGPGGKPVFNFRSDNRSFGGSDRVLIPADGFYEHTTPADPKQKRKDRWLFTLAGAPWFFIAGIVKNGAFAMLTTQPGPDVAPYHDRQVVVLPPRDALAWLDLARPESELLRPLPAGSLRVAPMA
jgi:putative SOS response-associated peptidase YedK